MNNVRRPNGDQVKRTWRLYGASRIVAGEWSGDDGTKQSGG